MMLVECVSRFIGAHVVALVLVNLFHRTGNRKWSAFAIIEVQLICVWLCTGLHLGIYSNFDRVEFSTNIQRTNNMVIFVEFLNKFKIFMHFEKKKNSLTSVHFQESNAKKCVLI